jgi:rubredoxin
MLLFVVWCRGDFYRRVLYLVRNMSQDYKKWQCIVCGWIYDEAEGCADEGLEAGTRWSDVPEDWSCPDCGVGKDDFEMIEI